VKKNPKAASIAEWDALLARYPLGSPWEMARQFLSVAGSNAVVLYLLVTGRMRPFHLVVLVAIEALLLSAIAWIQSRLVPRSALMESKPQPLRARLGTLAFGASGSASSTPSSNSAARWLTLFLGGIPFFVPLAFGVWTISTARPSSPARAFWSSCL
jgi:hypothetical protein